MKNIFDLQTIDEAVDFYQINKEYKQRAYECMGKIVSNDFLKENFMMIFDILYLKKNNEFRKLWEIDKTEELFGQNADIFSTNLMILMGAKFHQKNMETLKFTNDQIELHKKRVKECFLNDLENRKLLGVRISQMLWASYFINASIIEVGTLQFEYDDAIGKIKIHIPAQIKLDFNEVKNSIENSKKAIYKYFQLEYPTYVCNSWLLSKQLLPLLDDNSNIRKFQTLFNIEEGNTCNKDILNFVFKVKENSELTLLPEETSLQKKIKEELLKGKDFKLGEGKLNIKI